MTWLKFISSCTCAIACCIGASLRAQDGNGGSPSDRAVLSADAIQVVAGNTAA